MNIAGVPMALANTSISSDVGIAMLSKTMDANESLGAGLVNMMEAAAMEQSVNPNLGSVIDIRI